MVSEVRRSFFLLDLLHRNIFFFLIAKLESVFESIQMQQTEQWEAQSKELYSAQESITSMSSDVVQIRRR